MFKKRQSALIRELKKHPGEMFVTDSIIAVMIDEKNILLIKGDFKDITAEAANEKLQNALKAFAN